MLQFARARDDFRRAVSESNGYLPESVLVTDLDGTLNHHAEGVSADDRAALQKLGEEGVVRVVATGRSPHATRRVLPPDFPIDYLVFSSGAGILEWKTGTLLYCRNLPEPLLYEGVETLVRLRVDFMIQDAIPENHLFRFHATGKPNPDFALRCQRLKDQARPFCAWDWEAGRLESASQFLVIDPVARSGELHERLRAELPRFNVIRATSPLDGQSSWLEVFEPEVSKSKASQWIADRLKIPHERTLAIGNDYNDVDLLAWAHRAYLMENSPSDLGTYPFLPARSPISAALSLWPR